jgi:hypothetical protein
VIVPTLSARRPSYFKKQGGSREQAVRHQKLTMR